MSKKTTATLDAKLEAQVYTKEGKAATMVTLPAEVFGVAWNADLVHQVVVSMQGNARAGTAHTKGRGDVRGGGKKPWKQKGTGRARHGSSRSPIWVGGGVAHGPRNDKDFSRKINKNARAKALASVLSQKLRDDEVIFVDSLTQSEPKTKEAKNVLKALSTISGMEKLSRKRVNAAVILIPDRDLNTELSFQNFGNIAVVQTKDINPVELLTYKFVVVAKPEENIAALTHRVHTKSVRKSLSAGKVTAK